MLGYSSEEMLGQSAALIFTPEDVAQGVPEQEFKTARTSGTAVDDRWHLCKDGDRFWGSGIVTALYDNEGNPDGFTKVLRNLTEQRMAQEERERLLGELNVLNKTLEQRVAERTEALQLQNDALQNSEKRFRQIFQAGPVASCLTTLEDDLFLNVNETFLQLTGYTREEVLGRSILELDMWSSAEDRNALETAEKKVGSFRNLELRLRTGAGDTLVILASGEVIGLNGERANLKMFYDISERKRTEEHFMRAIQEVMSDTAWFSRQVLERLAHVRSGNVEFIPASDLSRRERQVLKRLAGGVGNKRIAEDLGIATQTVRNYLSIIYDKLGVHSRAEAIVWARERGFG